MLDGPLLVRGSALRDEFSCPITRELMRDPVIAADGHTYDREAIEMWLRNHDTSPKTGQPMERLSLVPNLNLRRLIKDLLAEGGEGLYLQRADSDSSDGDRDGGSRGGEPGQVALEQGGVVDTKQERGREQDREYRFALVAEQILVLKCLGPTDSDWNDKSFRVTERGCVGGRKQPAMLAGADFMQFSDATVSRRHFGVVFDKEEKQFSLCDFGSAGGTFVRLATGVPTPLYPGMMIMLGKHQLEVTELSSDDAQNETTGAEAEGSNSNPESRSRPPRPGDGVNPSGASRNRGTAGVNVKEGAATDQEEGGGGQRERGRPTSAHSAKSSSSKVEDELSVLRIGGLAGADGSEHRGRQDSSRSPLPHENGAGGEDDASVLDTPLQDKRGEGDGGTSDDEKEMEGLEKSFEAGAKLAKGHRRVCLECFAPEGTPIQGSRFFVGRGGATLGRRQTNTIAFSHESGGTVMGIDASISGEHARIVYDEDGDFLHIMDGTPTKPSTNGTWFRLSGMHAESRPYPLSNGSEILVGTVRFSVTLETMVVEKELTADNRNHFMSLAKDRNSPPRGSIREGGDQNGRGRGSRVARRRTHREIDAKRSAVRAYGHVASPGKKAYAGEDRGRRMMKRRQPTGQQTGPSNEEKDLDTRDTRWWKWCWKKNRSAGPGKNNGNRSAFGAVLRPFKDVVATNKTRFMEDGFDLDIAYVTKRIIVHGVPNVSADPLYEDPRTEVRRLLDKYHFDRYKVYNFASELAQMTPPTQRVDARVERYPFTDDTCPPLESVVDFCENAKAWLDAHEDNVVSLHCKAGKGRAGIMAACLMVRMGETAATAVESFDATQGADIRRTGMNHRAWVFLYERLIREVWGLRETIGTVSGQNPSLRAPPRLATGIRDVSLQMEVPPRQSRWKQILHHPSCAVYQQTPGGKALVHRARMPSVSPRKKGQRVSTFAAALPRSVVVEGTFQVVVSAATGLFGIGKNVLDVWCNTTFLGEDGGREVFTFTENDLPPGHLAKRLLAANVSVVLTHAPPDAPSPGSRQIHAVDWEGMALGGDGAERDTTAASSTLAFIAPVEHSATPETDPEEASDESAYDNAVVSNDSSSGNSNSNSNSHRESDSDALTISGGGGAYKSPAQGSAGDSSDDDEDDVEDDGRFYLSSDDEDSTKGTPARRGGSGGLEVTGGLDPLRVVVSPSPWNVLGTPGNFTSGGGFMTPLSTRCPSPLRSCPRSAISSKRERLNERTDVAKEEESTSTAVVPSGVPRWASTKTFGAAPGRKEELSPMDTAGGSEKQLGRRPRAVKPLGSLEGDSLALPTPESAAGAGAGGKGAGQVNGVRISRKPWAAAAAPGAVDTNGGPGVRLEKIVLRGYTHAEGNGNGSTSGSSSRGSRPDEEGEGQASSKTIEVNVASKHSTASSGFKRPSPAVKTLLDAAAARSFEDLQSSKHTSAFGSEADTDHSEDGGDLSLGTDMDSFSDGDGWANGETENRLMVTSGASASSLEIVRSEGLEAVQPLKGRVWPPPRGVVAGVEEVQGALESPNGSDGEQLQQVSRHARRHGSKGMAWGEDAKLALARKRLQWERSRRGTSEGGTQSLRLHAALVAKREAELLAIETDVKQAVRLLEERIARRESAEAALKKWRRQLPPKAYNDVMSCLAGNQAFGR
eukprot:g17614.t2